MSNTEPPPVVPMRLARVTKVKLAKGSSPAVVKWRVMVRPWGPVRRPAAFLAVGRGAAVDCAVSLGVTRVDGVVLI